MWKIFLHKNNLKLKSRRNYLKENRIQKYLWTDKGKEFYNKNLKEVLDKRNVKLYFTQNEEKSSVVKRWNRTITTKMWKRFTKQNSTQYCCLI